MMSMMTKAAKDKEKFNPATSFKEAAGSFFVFGTKIIYGPPLFCWFYSLIMHFCVFAFGELLVENNAVFALYHKAFSVFAFVGFLVKNGYTLLFCLCFDNNKKSSNPYGSRTSADGVKWTRTIDPHDVNVIL